MIFSDFPPVGGFADIDSRFFQFSEFLFLSLEVSEKNERCGLLRLSLAVEVGPHNSGVTSVGLSLDFERITRRALGTGENTFYPLSIFSVEPDPEDLEIGIEMIL